MTTSSNCTKYALSSVKGVVSQDSEAKGRKGSGDPFLAKIVTALAQRNHRSVRFAYKDFGATAQNGTQMIFFEKRRKEKKEKNRDMEVFPYLHAPCPWDY